MGRMNWDRVRRESTRVNWERENKREALSLRNLVSLKDSEIPDRLIPPKKRADDDRQRCSICGYKVRAHKYEKHLAKHRAENARGGEGSTQLEKSPSSKAAATAHSGNKPPAPRTSTQPANLASGLDRCPHCGVGVKTSRLQQHAAKCQERQEPVKKAVTTQPKPVATSVCQYCRVAVSSATLQAHQEECRRQQRLMESMQESKRPFVLVLSHLKSDGKNVDSRKEVPLDLQDCRDLKVLAERLNADPTKLVLLAIREYVDKRLQR